MIDQNTVIHISFDESPVINLGRLSVFEYTESESNGRITLLFSRHQLPMNKDDISGLVKRVNDEALISLFTDSANYSYKTKLEEVCFRSFDGWETLEITATRT